MLATNTTLLILNVRHLERVLDVFVDPYNGHRPHRAQALNRPTRHARRSHQRRNGATLVSSAAIVSVVWLHEYGRAA